jgi:RHS repeat-associated protein
VLDHLGSVAVITDSTGSPTTAIRQFYDAWGAMRNANGSPDTTCSIPPASPSTRGYTNQEEIPAVCLVNYNARIYDPQIGRFMSADPVVQNAFALQALNRYAYVWNNPLAYDDPTGNDIEAVDVTAEAIQTGNPVLIAAAVVVDVLSVIFGFDLFGHPPPVPHPVGLGSAANPAQSSVAGGNSTGLPQVQNTAVPANDISNAVPTSSACANADATQTAAVSYSGAAPQTDSAQILAANNSNNIETVIVNGAKGRQAISYFSGAAKIVIPVALTTKAGSGVTQEFLRSKMAEAQRFAQRLTSPDGQLHVEIQDATLTNDPDAITF